MDLPIDDTAPNETFQMSLNLPAFFDWIYMFVRDEPVSVQETTFTNKAVLE